VPVNRKEKLKRARISGWRLRRSHPVKAVNSKPMEFIVHADRVMWAKNEFHAGQAVWRYSLGEWICVKTSECLSFLIKCTRDNGKFELVKRGYEWEWH
jgi:hypothetical protein